jgi:hypothetical protein
VGSNPATPIRVFPDPDGPVGGFDGQGGPAWAMPTWMRCPATTRAPRLDTRRWTRIGSAAGTGGGPVGRASRTVDGRVLDGYGRVVGRASADGRVYDQHQEIAARVTRTGIVYDKDEKEVGTVSATGDIVAMAGASAFLLGLL